MIYQFLATGFEECEALATIDICRRAGLNTLMVSITGNLVVESAHGVKITADLLFEDCNPSEADMLMLPGGMPGATNLLAHKGLCQAICNHYQAGKPLSAICAAPLVFGNLGLLKGIKATCYPGFEPQLHGAITTGRLLEQDGQFITAKGPGAAYALGFAIVAHFCGAEVADTISKGMICQ